MPYTRLFIGSSSAARAQAKAVVKHFASPTLTFLPWWDAFTPGRTLLDDLNSISGTVDGAILLITPESPATIRGRDVTIPNLNVLFEFGYFYGHFGPSRVATINYGDVHLPSDLAGYTYVSGSSTFKRGAAVAVGKKTESSFTRWVQQL